MERKNMSGRRWRRIFVNEVTGETLKHDSASVLYWLHLICGLAWEVAKKYCRGWVVISMTLYNYRECKTIGSYGLPENYKGSRLGWQENSDR